MRFRDALWIARLEGSDNQIQIPRIYLLNNKQAAFIKYITVDNLSRSSMVFSLDLFYPQAGHLSETELSRHTLITFICTSTEMQSFPTFCKTKRNNYTNLTSWCRLFKTQPRYLAFTLRHPPCQTSGITPLIQPSLATDTQKYVGMSVSGVRDAPLRCLGSYPLAKNPRHASRNRATRHVTLT